LEQVTIMNGWHAIVGIAALLATATTSAQQPAPAASAASPTAEPSALFGSRESASFLDISPSGRYVVYIDPARGTAAAAVVADLVGGGDARPVLRSSGQPERLSWCRFVSDTRLICSVRGNSNVAGRLIPFSRLFAVNADGSNIRELGQRASAYDARLRQFSGQILDWLAQDGNAVLMAREYVPDAGGDAASHMSRSRDGLGVDRIDINNLHTSSVEPPDRRAAGYISDGRGNVRMMAAAQTQAEGQLDSQSNYYYRLAGSRDWRRFSTYDSATREGMLPLAVDGARDVAYVLKLLNGRLALYRVRLDESLAAELVYANDAVDVDDVVRIGRAGAVAGVTFAEERRRVIWFDPQFAELSRNLSRAVPGQPGIDFVGASRDENKVVILARSDSNPGRYYLYDRTTRAMEEIMPVRPELDGVRLASVRPLTYASADGVAVPAYLTLPPGHGDMRGLPAVVLPHGGPSARDELGFDWLAQFLAHQGYAVLQPNYRGSAGYGDAWFARNGFRGWQTSIGDVTAAGRWMISQGADANRLAIVGWSYGGYAALQAGVTEPGLFKAIVAIAPVTDLALLSAQAEGFDDYLLVRQFIGQGPHVRAGSPLQNIGAISAPVLMFHGTRDTNVGIVQSQRMDAALRAAGKSSELVTFDGLEHDLADSEARVRMLARISAFLSANMSH
jgi:dipeptidyl aminopeptidase/acylaminoacyl peptidase